MQNCSYKLFDENREGSPARWQEKVWGLGGLESYRNGFIERKGDTRAGFFFLAALHGLWDLSSSTRDQTQATTVQMFQVLITGPPRAGFLKAQ